MNNLRSSHSSGSSSSRRIGQMTEDVDYQHIATPRPRRGVMRAAAQGFTSNRYTGQQWQYLTEEASAQSVRQTEQHYAKMAAIDQLIRKVVDDPSELKEWKVQLLKEFVTSILTEVEGEENTYTPSKADMRAYLMEYSKMDPAKINRLLTSISNKTIELKVEPRQDLTYAQVQGMSIKQRGDMNKALDKLGILHQLSDDEKAEEWETITRPYLLIGNDLSSDRMRLLYRWLWHVRGKRYNFLSRMDIAREKAYERYNLPPQFWQEFYDSADPRFRTRSVGGEGSSSVLTEEQTTNEQEEPQEGEKEEIPDLNLTLEEDHATQSDTHVEQGSSSSQADSPFETNIWQRFSSEVPRYGYGHAGHSFEMYGHAQQNVNPFAYAHPSLQYEQQIQQQPQLQQSPAGVYGYLYQNVNPAHYLHQNQQYQQHFIPNQQYQQQFYPQHQQQLQSGRSSSMSRSRGNPYDEVNQMD